MAIPIHAIGVVEPIGWLDEETGEFVQSADLASQAAEEFKDALKRLPMDGTAPDPNPALVILEQKAARVRQSTIEGLLADD